MNAEAHQINSVNTELRVLPNDPFSWYFFLSKERKFDIVRNNIYFKGLGNSLFLIFDKDLLSVLIFSLFRLEYYFVPFSSSAPLICIVVGNISSTLIGDC